MKNFFCKTLEKETLLCYYSIMTEKAKMLLSCKVFEDMIIRLDFYRFLRNL